MVSIFTLGACDDIIPYIPTPSDSESENENENESESESESENEEGETDLEETICEHEYEYSETIDPTCTSDGYDLYICFLCGEADIRNKVDALGHTDPSSWTDSTEGEYHYYQCERCLEYISASHTYSDPVVVEPTCINEGSATYICLICSHEKVETLSPTGAHSYGEWTTVEPSCLVDGYRYRTCSVCSDVDYEVLEATGHTPGEFKKIDDEYHGTVCTVCSEPITEIPHSIAYKDETCSTHTKYCLYCEYEDTENHTLNSEVIDPTCTTDGYTQYTCSVCNYEYTDNPTDKLGHLFETYTNDNNGETHTASCSRGCGEKDTQNHEWGEGVVTTEPKCEEDGARTYTCSQCGATKIVAEPMTGHTSSGVISFGEETHGTKCLTCGEVLTSESHSKVYTYSDTTYHTVTCSGCNYTNSEAHDYSSVVTAPTCTEAGYTYHECSLCHNHYNDNEVEAKGHSYTNYVDDGNDLTHTATCDNGCGSSDTKNHDWNDGVVTQEVGCAKEGITIYTCTTCGATYTYTIEALGHLMGDYEYYSETSHRSTCSRCGYYIQSSHRSSYTNDVYVEPTCTEDGYYYNYCTTCNSYYKNTTTEGEPALGHDLKVCNGKIVCSRCEYESDLKAFSEASWDEIAFVSENGAASLTYSLGETKDIALTTGETITMRIIGFDHDNITGTSDKAGITLEMVNCLNTRHAYNGSSSDYSNVGGWAACDLRTYINETVFDELPTEVSDNIKAVDKVTNEGYKVDESDNNTITTGLVTSSDKIFILSLAEIYGAATIDSVSTGTSIGLYSSIYDKEGEQYAYYSDLLYNEGNQIGPRTACTLLEKTYNSGTATNWWTRTARVENSSNACNFNNSNNYIGYDNTYLTYGVCISFCI